MLAAAKEPSPTPIRESGMPTTLWKCMVLKGKYSPCPNRDASIAKRSSHTRRSKPPNTLMAFSDTRQSYPQRAGTL